MSDVWQVSLRLLPIRFMQHSRGSLRAKSWLCDRRTLILRFLEGCSYSCTSPQHLPRRQFFNSLHKGHAVACSVKWSERFLLACQASILQLFEASGASVLQGWSVARDLQTLQSYQPLGTSIYNFGWSYMRKPWFLLALLLSSWCRVRYPTATWHLSPNI